MRTLAAALKANWLIALAWAGAALTTAGAATVTYQIGTIHTPATGAGAAVATVGIACLAAVRAASRYTIIEETA